MDVSQTKPLCLKRVRKKVIYTDMIDSTDISDDDEDFSGFAEHSPVTSKSNGSSKSQPSGSVSKRLKKSALQKPSSLTIEKVTDKEELDDFSPPIASIEQSGPCSSSKKRKNIASHRPSREEKLFQRDLEAAMALSRKETGCVDINSDDKENATIEDTHCTDKRDILIANKPNKVNLNRPPLNIAALEPSELRISPGTGTKRSSPTMSLTKIQVFVDVHNTSREVLPPSRVCDPCIILSRDDLNCRPEIFSESISVASTDEEQKMSPPPDAAVVVRETGKNVSKVDDITSITVICDSIPDEVTLNPKISADEVVSSTNKAKRLNTPRKNKVNADDGSKISMTSKLGRKRSRCIVDSDLEDDFDEQPTIIKNLGKKKPSIIYSSTDEESSTPINRINNKPSNDNCTKQTSSSNTSPTSQAVDAAAVMLNKRSREDDPAVTSHGKRARKVVSFKEDTDTEDEWGEREDLDADDISAESDSSASDFDSDSSSINKKSSSNDSAKETVAKKLTSSKNISPNISKKTVISKDERNKNSAIIKPINISTTRQATRNCNKSTPNILATKSRIPDPVSSCNQEQISVLSPVRSVNKAKTHSSPVITTKSDSKNIKSFSVQSPSTSSTRLGLARNSFKSPVLTSVSSNNLSSLPVLNAPKTTQLSTGSSAGLRLGLSKRKGNFKSLHPNAVVK